MSGGGILQMDDVKFYWETIKLLFSNILQLCFDIETDKCVAPPITFVYWFGLQNLRRHMCCRAIKTKGRCDHLSVSFELLIFCKIFLLFFTVFMHNRASYTSMTELLCVYMTFFNTKNMKWLKWMCGNVHLHGNNTVCYASLLTCPCDMCYS